MRPQRVLRRRSQNHLNVAESQFGTPSRPSVTFLIVSKNASSRFYDHESLPRRLEIAMQASYSQVPSSCAETPVSGTFVGIKAADNRAEKAVLHSWKEITNYFERGVRTGQRWEHDLRLPIRRIGEGILLKLFVVVLNELADDRRALDDRLGR